MLGAAVPAAPSRLGAWSQSLALGHWFPAHFLFVPKHWPFLSLRPVPPGPVVEIVTFGGSVPRVPPTRSLLAPVPRLARGEEGFQLALVLATGTHSALALAVGGRVFVGGGVVLWAGFLCAFSVIQTHALKQYLFLTPQMGTFYFFFYS